MRNWGVLVACAVALAGCQTDGGTAMAAKPPPPPSSAEIERAPGYVRPADPQALAAAKQVVTGKLKDPESAKFVDMRRKTTPNMKGEPTDVVCGRVNAKNGFGGYTGNKPFVYFVGDKSSISSEEDITLAGVPSVIRNFCPEML